jgi:SAM-dependent methyltransferase
MIRGGAYIHGTEPTEQDRLARLNRLTNAAFVDFLRVPSGACVLEVGSGLGILATEVAFAAVDVRVVGVERASAQLDAAARNPRVRYVRGDAHDLAFADGAFDLVYARFVLEHVSDPTHVLREMRRVCRSGGRVAACENDITLARLDPPCPTFDLVWNLFRRYQEQLGGDGEIGRRLYRLFRAAGFSAITLSVEPEVHWHGSPRFADWIQNLAGNIESARHGIIESRLCGRDQIEQALGELDSLMQNQDASAWFMWNRAVALR